MSLSSALLEAAVDQLSSLPGVGRRSAMRLALELLRRDTAEVLRFSEAIRRLREEVRYCEECCNISDEPRCTICRDAGRDRGLMCVVEDIRDVIAHAETYGLAPYSADPANYCTAKTDGDCGRLINYDAAHKTSAVHAILADKFLKRFGLKAH